MIYSITGRWTMIYSISPPSPLLGEPGHRCLATTTTDMPC